MDMRGPESALLAAGATLMKIPPRRGEKPTAEKHVVEWPQPIDFLGDAEITGAPVLRPHHLPDAISGFAFDTAARMGVEPAAVALSAIVSIASVAHDDWQVQPKVHDTTWTESPRLWAAIIGSPSILKSPVLRATTSPIDRLEARAREEHAAAMRHWKAEVAALKAEKAPPPYPAQP